MARTIALTKGQVALVDDEDFDLVSRFNWYARRGVNTYYAERRGPRDENGKRRTISMHRLVLGLGDFHGDVVDHINRDGLDNRRVNLRVTDKSGNALNAVSSRVPRSCETCGSDYLPSHTAARFCSISCARRQSDHPRSRRVLPDLACPTCGVTFRPHSHRTKFCSTSCANRSRKMGLR